MQVIECNQIPKSKSPLSQAIIVGELLFVSGQLYRNTTQKATTVEEETKVVMDNLGAILKEAGITFDHVCKVNVYLTDLKDVSQFNRVYQNYFLNHYPTRCCVEVSHLAENARVEVELIAAMKMSKLE